MSKKQEIKNELAKLLPQMKKVAKMMEKAEDDWTNYFNESDPEDMYLRSMFYRIAEKLEDARRIAKQVDAKVTAEGILYKNSAGRYEIEDGVYFTSGSAIEFLLEDEDRSEWIYSSVEHNEDYYIVNHKRLNMEGIRARIKYSPDWD
jgi:hypothetical protein